MGNDCLGLIKLIIIILIIIILFYFKTGWGFDSVVQSDCCDSVTSIKSKHNYTETFEGACVTRHPC